MLLIFNSQPSNRADYIFHLIMGELLGIEHKVVSDPDQFGSFSGPKFSYGSEPLADEVFLQSAGLLSENGFSRGEPEMAGKEGSMVLFPVRHLASALPFDLFSASFYLVTRYEEYGSVTRDEHDRFLPENSIAYQMGCHGTPVVNRWALSWAEVLRERFPDLPGAGTKFTFLPTVDVDQAYAYRYKGGLRNMGGLVRDLLHGNIPDTVQRYRVLTGLERDPFDTYDYISAIHEKYRLRPVFFILLGDHGPNDKNISHTHPRLRELIQNLAKDHEVGIHPSYASFTSPERLKTEIERLAAIIGREVTCSRQHFLRFRLPQTFRDLMNLGIRNEFSMGYAQEPGFRAGICTPYFFFDLAVNKTTPLRIHPFTVMDGTLADYKKYTQWQAENAVLELLNEVKTVGGTFISIWHNESLSDQKRWHGWRGVYEKMAQMAMDEGSAMF